MISPLIWWCIMYIQPNTTLNILKDCPLDTTYDHTIYFADDATQASYFSGLSKYKLNDLTYQRVNKNKVRVQIKADLLYDCNYIMFQNSSFGNKWFYAFIKSVEYINNITSEIEYEIDVMQTWAFDYILEQCFIDREHSATDNIGDNLVPENVELGEYVADDFLSTNRLGALSIVVASTFDESYTKVDGTYYSGIFSGLYYNVFENNSAGAQACADFIKGAAEKSDGIVSVFLMPSAFVVPPLSQPNSYDLNYDKKLTLKRSDGSNVKNKKLLTFPYNFLYVSNLQGNGGAFPYEFFSSQACSFMITGDMSPSPSVLLVPKEYKGVTVNYDEKMSLSGYPQLSFNVDTFKSWLAQNVINLPLNALTTGLSFGSNVASGNVGGAVNNLTQAAGLISQFYQHAIMPNQARGSAGNTTLAAVHILDFAFMHKHIQPQFASIIDDYFNVYGYATHRVKTPNRNVRPHWCYTKTVKCTIKGSIPCDDANKICGIYNNGITFWKNGNEIGDYSLDNSV